MTKITLTSFKISSSSKILMYKIMLLWNVILLPLFLLCEPPIFLNMVLRHSASLVASLSRIISKTYILSKIYIWLFFRSEAGSDFALGLQILQQGLRPESLRWLGVHDSILERNIHGRTRQDLAAEVSIDPM